MSVYFTKAFRLSWVVSLSLTLSGCYWITLVSKGSGGPSGNDSSSRPSVSSDGRFVAFESWASDLVDDDTNGTVDIFVLDLQTKAINRVSVDSMGNQANGFSQVPEISSTGRFVAFLSGATNLVANDTNGVWDIFVHDTETGTTRRVSVDSSGDEGNGRSAVPDVSTDGRFVSFESEATNLVDGDTNFSKDVFVHDTQSGTTIRASVDSDGNEGDALSFDARISDDGRFVAFQSWAWNLAPDVSNNGFYLHDTQTGTTSRVDVDNDGNYANSGGSNTPGVGLSANGRYVAFQSGANNLGVHDPNTPHNTGASVYLRDTLDGVTTMVSLNDDGIPGNADCTAPDVSGDGRYVSFECEAATNNLAPNDTNERADVFIHDRITGSTRRLSVDALGAEANGGSHNAALSADGRYVAFESRATNLVSGDANGVDDVFIKAIPKPRIDSIVPEHLPIGATTSVTISGSGFLPDTTLWFNNGSFSKVVIVDDNTITADLSIPETQASGAYNFGVNIFGTGAGTATGASTACTGCITLQ